MSLPFGVLLVASAVALAAIVVLVTEVGCGGVWVGVVLVVVLLLEQYHQQEKGHYQKCW
jgi:hypothetical protein